MNTRIVIKGSTKSIESGIYKIGQTAVFVQKDKELYCFGNPGQTIKKKKEESFNVVQRKAYVSSVGINNIERSGTPSATISLTISELEAMLKTAKERKAFLEKEFKKPANGFFIHPSPDLSVFIGSEQKGKSNGKSRSSKRVQKKQKSR
jgi:hypothetical protein